MNIKILMWSNVLVKHSNKSYKENLIPLATISLEDNVVHITEYNNCQGSNTGRSFTYAKASIVELTSHSIKIEAEYFFYSFIDKTSVTHPVIITAEF